MATRQEEALKILKGITSDDTVEVTHLEGGITVIKVIPQRKAEEKNKWARFADDMHEESPLKGQSELVTTRVREFRDGFSFEGE
ncbi:MAG: hypothetical protein ABFS45_08055 [Pseudomonadota bacterium]